MTEMLPAWLPMALVGLGVVLTLIAAVALLPRAIHTRTAAFYCPWRARHVMVRYLTCDGKDPSHIVSCTAFDHPESCSAPCVGADGPGVGSREPAGVVLGD
jgi:hypothetical protein